MCGTRRVSIPQPIVRREDSRHAFACPPTRSIPRTRGKARKSTPCSVAINQLRRMKMIPRNTICLWFDGTALEAATFYAETFPAGPVGAVTPPRGDFRSGHQGALLTYRYTVAGRHPSGLKGAQPFRTNRAYSFHTHTNTQHETNTKMTH